MAKKFQFRLEAVRRVREQARDNQRRVVADHVRRVTESQRRIRDLSEQSAQALRDLADMQRTGVLDTTMICRQHVHRDEMHRAMRQEEVRLAQHRTELATQQSRLADTNKELKVIEKLRDKQMKQHQEIENREQQTVSDEVSIQNYLRRRALTRDEVLA